MIDAWKTFTLDEWEDMTLDLWATLLIEDDVKTRSVAVGTYEPGGNAAATFRPGAETIDIYSPD